MKMVLSPVGRYCDQYTESPDTNASYAQVTWAHLKEMMDSGLWRCRITPTICTAIPSRATGPRKTRGRVWRNTRRRFRNDLGEMQRKMKEYTGFEPTAFTSSLRGDQLRASLEVVKELLSGFLLLVRRRSITSRAIRNASIFWGAICARGRRDRVLL